MNSRLACVCLRLLTITGLMAVGVPLITASAPAAVSSPAGSFVSVPAARTVDTGSGVGVPRAAIRANTAVTVQITGRAGVPASGVGSVLLNAVAAGGTASGSITAYPTGAVRPGTPNVYYLRRQTVANSVSVPIGTGGKVTFFNGSSGTVQLIVNVHGYTLAGVATQAGTYRPVTAARLIDTGTGVGVPRAAVRANTAVTVQITGRAGVPASGVGTVLLNVVAAGGIASGSLTAYPAGAVRPRTPSIHYAPRQTVANLVHVPVGTGGKITVFNGSAGTVQLIANVHSYTLAGVATRAGTYRAVTAARIADSGAGTGVPRAAVRPNTAVTVQVTGHAGVPRSGVATALLNVIAAGGTASGSITSYPAGAARPGTPNVYYAARRTVANLVQVPLGTGGKITFFNGSAGTVQLIVNLHGYTIQDTTAPARVTNISVSNITITSLKLSWQNPADADFVGVTVRSASGSTPPSSPSTGTAVAELTNAATEVTVTGLAPGTQYAFAFFAHDFTPNYSSAATTTATTAATEDPPGPVTDLSTSVTTPTSVSLTWKNPTGSSLTGVMLRRLAGATPPASPSDGSLVADVSKDTTEYTDRGLTAGAEYSYSLFAHNSTPDFAAAAAVRATTSIGTPVNLERSVAVSVGSSIPIDVSDTFSRVVSVQPRPGSLAGLTLQLTDTGVITLAATSITNSGSASVVADGSACIDKNCDIPFVVDINASIIALAETTPASEDFTQPAPDRLARAETIDDVKALDDEVILTIGSPQNPGTLGEAQSLASGVGAVVSGALEDLGVYELRWTTAPADLDAILAELSSSLLVASATRSTFASAEINATPPGDWNDDGQAVKWPFQQIRAQEAWDISTAGNVKVGIVDGGTVYRDHEDLNVIQTLGNAEVLDHSTHVAGLACAVANGRGLVGTAWGCPVVSSGLGDANSWEQLVKNVLQAARQTAKSGPRVINMSLGRNNHTPDYCVSSAQNDGINALMQSGAPPFRQLFNGPVGRDIVWTLSAGNNCGKGVHSPWGVSWALPNVITVAASNSDGTLASFSNFGPGVEVAAPGGVGVNIPGGAGGIWSTTTRRCGDDNKGLCSNYAPMPGTSMASPIVAGVAALAISANLNASAADVGSCITSTAGIATPQLTSQSTQPADLGKPVRPKIAFTGSIPVIDARAAVECVQDGVRHGDVLIAGQGDRTSSGNGTDLGDITAQLASLGYSVATSQTLPNDLSGFGQIWYVDTDAMTEGEQDRVAAYVAGGRSAYLTGEWGCCSVDSSSIALINRLVPGSSVTHAGPDANSVTILPTAPFGLATTPRTVSTLTTASPGSLSGVAPANVVGYSSEPDRAVVAAWGPQDVTGGGRLAIVMDINWIAQQYRGPSWSPFVQNLAQFLQPSVLLKNGRSGDKATQLNGKVGLDPTWANPPTRRNLREPASAAGPHR
jgi:hypothetical protein